MTCCDGVTNALFSWHGSGAVRRPPPSSSSLRAHAEQVPSFGRTGKDSLHIPSKLNLHALLLANRLQSPCITILP